MDLCYFPAVIQRSFQFNGWWFSGYYRRAHLRWRLL